MISAPSMPQPTATQNAAVTGAVKLLLRGEAVFVLAGAALAYHALGGHWLLFAILFFAPDLSMFGYFAGRRFGAWAYNLAHTYLAPAILGLTGWGLATPSLYGVALIWAAHIGFDRALGFGLKYPDGFGATHLGWNAKGKGGG